MNKNRLIIIGASGHGKVISDIAVKNGYTDICFLDDNDEIESCMGYPVIGKTSKVFEYKNDDVIVGIGNAKIRERIMEELINRGFNVPTLIHPSASVSNHVEIGVGTVVMAGAVINADSKIGKGCIINTCSSVDHDNRIDDYVHVSVGSHLAGTVFVGKRTWIGIGATVINNVTICDDCFIGAGATVTKSLIKSGIYVGVPARRVK